VRQAEALSTGFAPLDAYLNGGWPAGALTELLVDGAGIGELRILMPALSALQFSGARGHRRSQLCWIAPPYIPYAPALARHGLDLSALVVVRPESLRDALWATEQAVRSRVCAAVLCWAQSIGQRSVRRLQLAAAESGGRVFLFRPARFAAYSSVAPLRIHLSRRSGSLRLELLRNRYGPTGRVNLSRRPVA